MIKSCFMLGIMFYFYLFNEHLKYYIHIIKILNIIYKYYKYLYIYI